jgi:carboxyl-terminal processing protease
MSRTLGLVLAFAVAACSGTRTPSGEAGRGQPNPSQLPVVGQPDPRELKLAMTVVKLLEEHHLRKRPIDDELSRRAFARYIHQLDPSKMFLLQADADALAHHADRIDDQLRAGELDLAHDGAARYGARLAVVGGVVATLLSTPLDTSDEEFIEVDGDKLELATSETELRDRWRRRLELEVLERVAMMEDRLDALAKAKHGTPDPDQPDDDATPPLRADEIPATPEAREAKARADLAEAYAARFTRLAKPPPLDAAADLVNAVAGLFDPHTVYMPPADKANFDISLTGTLEGIGAVLREDNHYIRVVEIVPGGASWRHGELDPGDLILTVKQAKQKPIDVADMPIDEVVQMIRGPSGTVVTLQIKKPSGEVKTIAITRDRVEIAEAYARGAVLKRKKAKQAYGYIHLPSFYGGSDDGQRTAAADVRRLLDKLRAEKVAGVVIDIRSNGGGLLGDAVEMTGHLVDKGPVVQVQITDGDREVLRDDDPGTAFDGPVVVLVDRFSASASEIVAGALQDYDRAVVVGTGPTHGKGTVQVLADLDQLTGGRDNLGSLKLTIQQFFRVSGSSTQWQGVVPDILLPDPYGHVDAGERELENSIPWSEISPASHTPWRPTWKVADLIGKSAARVETNDLLAKVAIRSELLRVRQAETRLPLEREAWQKRRRELRKELEATALDLDAAPQRFTVTMVEKEAEVAERPGGKTTDTLTRWRDSLSRDPWVDEALQVLADMAPPARKK